MDPLTIVSVILAGIQAFPKAIEFVENAYKTIEGMVKGGLITKEVQDAVKLQIDAVRALSAAGVVPLAWEVSTKPPA